MLRVDVTVPTREENRELIRRAQAGDVEAREEMILRNMPLVKTVASRMATRDVEDAIQEGTIGLIRAIDRFDLARGTEFSTYAMPKIRQAIQVGWMNAMLIRVDRRQGGGDDGSDEMPVRSNAGFVTQAFVLRAKARAARAPAASTSRPVHRAGRALMTVGDTIPAREEAGGSREEKADEVKAALARLEPRYAEIITRRVWRGETLRQVGAQAGISYEWVRLLEKEAYAKLREMLA